MTRDEKVLFLFKLSVETATAFRSAALQSPKPVHTSSDFEGTIESLYKKFEFMLEEKLKGESR